MAGCIYCGDLGLTGSLDPSPPERAATEAEAEFGTLRIGTRELRYAVRERRCTTCDRVVRVAEMGDVSLHLFASEAARMASDVARTEAMCASYEQQTAILKQKVEDIRAVLFGKALSG